MSPIWRGTPQRPERKGKRDQDAIGRRQRPFLRIKRRRDRQRENRSERRDNHERQRRDDADEQLLGTKRERESREEHAPRELRHDRLRDGVQVHGTADFVERGLARVWLVRIEQRRCRNGSD